MIEAITSFRDEYEFLSNFYVIRGGIYTCWRKGVRLVSVPTVEHAFQASKAERWDDFMTICTAPTPGRAKELGRAVKLPHWWDMFKDQEMETHLRQKFRYPVLRRMLLDTHPMKLVEGNTWRDRYWGVYKGEGKNVLGLLLMKIREEERYKAMRSRR